jgi:hemerythrin
MTGIIWSDEMSVGIETLDADHKELIRLINRLADDEVRRNHTTLGEVVNKLMDYVAYHFEREEEFLEEKGYPALAHHAELHEGMNKYVGDLIRSRRAAFQGPPGKEIHDYLADWLKSHILIEDMKYAKWLGRGE